MIRISKSLLSVAPLSEAAVNTALASLSGWSTSGKGNSGKVVLEKQYVFDDFRRAWSFMESLVPFINETDHHPEWSNVYNRVHVCLTTHDACNKISQKDVDLARRMEEAFQKVNAK
jgi:4a-hydroxytetrahydrobiopterin dehydratase